MAQPRFNPVRQLAPWDFLAARPPVRRRMGALGALDPATLAQLAQNAGFTGSDVQTAVAIALAESSGNPTAYNPETAAGTPAGQGSYGLWQIYLKAHPEFRGQNLLDPQTNANAAYSIFSRSGFSAWSTYQSGTYQAFVTGSSPGPAAAAPAPVTLDASTGLPIDDSTPTPAVTVQQASVFGSASNATVGGVALGLGLLALYDLLSD